LKSIKIHELEHGPSSHELSHERDILDTGRSRLTT